MFQCQTTHSSNQATQKHAREADVYEVSGHFKDNLETFLFALGLSFYCLVEQDCHRIIDYTFAKQHSIKNFELVRSD